MKHYLRIFTAGKNIIRAVTAFCVTATLVAACTSDPPPVPAAEIVVPGVLPLPAGPLIEMIDIPGGDFLMGSPRGDGLVIERPAHQVTVTTFALGKFEVTQRQYLEITGMQPSSCKTNPENTAANGWETLPVEMISWYEALVFCNKLSTREELEPVYRINGSVNPDDWGEAPNSRKSLPWDSVEMSVGASGYRLPTEAEWEYAAKGGSTAAKDYKYSGADSAGEVSWYYENSGNKSHEIGKKPPNDLGLHDMSGNVMEWCWDWQGPYTAAAAENPTGPAAGQDRIMRGGGWSYAVDYCRTAQRHYNNPFYRGVNLGFRVARSR